MEEIKACKQYIFNLNIRGLQVPFDFKAVLVYLPVLSNLNITYGTLHAGARDIFLLKLITMDQAWRTKDNHLE